MFFLPDSSFFSFRRVAIFFLCFIFIFFVIAGFLPGDARDFIKSKLSLGDVDGTAHFLVSGAIVFLGLIVFRRCALVLVFGVFLGGLVELVQFWVPGRSSTWVDFFLDVAGVALGGTMYLLLRLWSRTGQSVTR